MFDDQLMMIEVDDELYMMDENLKLIKKIDLFLIKIIYLLVELLFKDCCRSDINSLRLR